MLESRGGVAGQPVPEGGAAGNKRGNGKIINISSLVAYQGKLGLHTYLSLKSEASLSEAMEGYRP
jgi:2-deoxy-D-gluconate 3-dehydrogenase